MVSTSDDFGFKFQINEIVRFKFLKNDQGSKFMKRPKGLVLERLLQECPGGVQRHYDLRMFNDDGYDVGVGTIHRFNEIELEPNVVDEAVPAGVE